MFFEKLSYDDFTTFEAELQFNTYVEKPNDVGNLTFEGCLFFARNVFLCWPLEVIHMFQVQALIFVSNYELNWPQKIFLWDL